MFGELGISVTREIPTEVLKGLMTGELTLHGGVIRGAAGQIVRHLATPGSALSTVSGGPVGIGAGVVGAVSGIASNYQLHSLSKEVQRVLSFTMANTVLAGLGLVTSLVGFSYLAEKIKQVDKKIDTLSDLIRSRERAQLLGAVDDYRQSSEAKASTKVDMLFRAQGTFGELAHHYKTQLQEVSKLPDIEATEGYFVIACIGNAICSSELGLVDSGHKQLESHYNDWAELARYRCGTLLNLNEAQRLLDSRYIEYLPAATLVDLLDFVHNEQRGIEWIDDLRKAFGPGTILTKPVTRITGPTIEFAKSLRARDEVLRSFVSHFDFLARKKISATQFAAALEEERKQQNADLLYWHEAPLS